MTLQNAAEILKNPPTNLKLQQQKVELAIKNVNEAILLQDESRKKTLELKNYFERLEWALCVDFKKFIKDLENSLYAEILPTVKDYYSNKKAAATRQARAKIIRICPYSLPTDQGFSNWLVMAKNQHSKDREQFIKRGEIKA